jgi:hypothetical protein
VTCFSTLDGARHDSLREMQPGALEVPEIATPTNKRCQRCQDQHANQKQLSP